MTEFKILSDKYKQERQNDYNIIYNNLLSSIINMFEFSGIPESVDTHMLIRYMFANGVCAIPLTVDNPPVCLCTLGGDINPYGYGTEVIATTQNGKSYRGKIGVDFAVFKNNTYMYPEFYILQTAKLLTEIRTSLKCNVINSRLAPMGKAKNDAEKTSLETGFEQIYKGKPYVVKSLPDWQDTNDNPVINFTDVKNSAYIPYLSQLEDDILQKFYYHYGINLKNENKRAQVNTEELQGADALVWTVPLMHLTELEKGIEMLRTVYPEAAVSFGGVWKKEFESYISNIDGDINGNTSENESEGGENENN